MGNDTATNPVPVELTAEQKAAAKAAKEAEEAAKLVETNRRIASIKGKFDENVDVKPYTFGFKTVELEDDNGKPTGEKYKRSSVDLVFPVPSIEGIVSIINNGFNEDKTMKKSLQLLLDAVEDVVVFRAREIVNDGFGTLKAEEINGDNFPVDAVTWDAIANLPKAERRGGGIAKDVWEDFGKDYLAVMPAITNKKVEQIQRHVKIFLTKFSTVKTSKPILSLLKEQLALYITNSPNADEYANCVQVLNDKVDSLLKIDDATMLANL